VHLPVVHPESAPGNLPQSRYAAEQLRFRPPDPTVGRGQRDLDRQEGAVPAPGDIAQAEGGSMPAPALGRTVTWSTGRVVAVASIAPSGDCTVT
jgi:hypothetical protein